jgi:hypothetical protein
MPGWLVEKRIEPGPQWNLNGWERPSAAKQLASLMAVLHRQAAPRPGRLALVQQKIDRA